MSRAEDCDAEGGTPTDAYQLLSRVRDLWQRRSELDTMEPGQLERMANDLGMTGRELRDLAARGPDAAHLLHERMRVLDLAEADVERVVQGLMRDLQRTCAGCGDNRVRASAPARGPMLPIVKDTARMRLA